MGTDSEDRKKSSVGTIFISVALLLPLLAVILISRPGQLWDGNTPPTAVMKHPESLNPRGNVVTKPPGRCPSAGNLFVVGEEEEWSDVCSRVSAEEDGFLSHCDVPTEGELRQKLGDYVRTRMQRYKGRCSGDALRFHCLEFAARQLGWCNWSRVADVSPIPPSSFINRRICEAITQRPPVFDEAGNDGDKIIFFYPSYGHLEMLKRSITALQHPNHIFLIQVDEVGYADEEFVEGVMRFANSEDNVCVARYSYVLYISASQVLVMWPALAWAEGIQGWTHFFLMGAQTYPIVSIPKIRRLCRTRKEENFFSSSLTKKYNARELSLVRRFSELLPYCRFSEKRGSRPDKSAYLGDWIDPEGNRRGPKSRIDWLEIQLGQKWQFAKSPGVEVLGASRDLVSFLLHDPGAKMFKQYFTYSKIACEHMVPSIVKHYLSNTYTDRSVCYMTWKPHMTSNKVLESSDWPMMANRKIKYLFARKFTLPGSQGMLERIDKELRHIDKKAR